LRSNSRRVQPTASPAAPYLAAALPIEQPLRFDHLTLEDGLSQNTVLAILQDRQGFNWAAPQDGLNRYDGYSFTVYKHDPQNPDSLSQSVIAMAPKSTNSVKENNMMSYLNILYRYFHEKTTL